MHTVAITGITGKSGTWMLRRMIKEKDRLSGYEFRTLIRKPSGYDLIENTPLKIKTIYGSLDNEQALKQLLDGTQMVVHIAGIGDSERVVSAAVTYGVKWLILVHTTGIYSKYKKAGESYRQAEEKIADMLRGKDIALTILRPTMIYGNMNDRNISVFIKMVDKLRLFPVVKKAEFELQPVWAKDLGDAYFQVLTNPQVTKNKEYILSGGSPVLFIDLLKTIEKKLGKKNIYISLPFWFTYGLAWTAYIITIGKIDYREKVQRLVEPRAYPYTKAADDFGYSPVSFELGIEEEINEYLQSKRGKSK